jgi:hypothetical protein
MVTQVVQDYTSSLSLSSKAVLLLLLEQETGSHFDITTRCIEE